MSKFKDGDRVVTTKNLFIVGHADDWLEAGAEGLIIGATKTQDYLIVKLDVVETPTYVREANLELSHSGGLENLSFTNGEMTVEYWEGNDLNAPEVRFCTKTYETQYDRDYNTETEIVGVHDMTREEMIALRDFLNRAIDKSEGWVYRGTQKRT